MTPPSPPTRAPSLTALRQSQVGPGGSGWWTRPLQAQPVYFTPNFAHDVIDGAAMGQPVIVSAPLLWVGGIVAAAPALNAAFVVVQFAIGLRYCR